MNRFISVILAVCLLALPCLGSAEEEFMLEDLVELEELLTYNDVEWTFPLALEDMDPVLIRLANKHMLLPKEDAPDPIVSMPARKVLKDGSTNGGVNKASGVEMQLQKECGEALVSWFEAGLTEGITLYLKSAYRSWQTQNTMYYNRLKKNNGKDDGWVSKPGASDHQTGLGCDIVSRSWRDKSMNEKFASTQEAAWMKETCAEYGFILRYPEDKQDITEINFEPWHYRYVGVPVARYIMENNLCLEEFHEQLRAAIDEFLANGGDLRYVQAYMQVSAEQ